jgi:hypothetical protein
MIDSYYRHSPEIFTIFLKDRVAANLAMELVEQHTNDLVRMQDGGDWIMDAQTRQDAIGVLESLSARGSLELKRDVVVLASALQNSTEGSMVRTYERLGGHPPARDHPKEVRLWQNVPNPFNPVTTIRFFLPATTHVTVEIFDVAGRSVAIVANDRRRFGEHEIQWNAERFASGIYFVRLKTTEVTRTRKIVLLK